MTKIGKTWQLDGNRFMVFFFNVDLHPSKCMYWHYSQKNYFYKKAERDRSKLIGI